MSNTSLTDWLTFVPAGVVRTQKAYIDLPAFSYSSQGTAGDASVIVAQFNFSASRDFYLLTRPTKPTGVSYGLCIRYRIGETVYRYKLWEDDAFVLSNATPLYNKQLIKKNFVLEIWNFAGQASVNLSAIRMITSVRSAPTDFRAIADYALAIGAEFTDLQNVFPTLPATPTYRWTCANNPSTIYPWTDTIQGQVFSDDGVGHGATFYGADSTWLQGRWKFVTGSNRRMFTVLPSMNWSTYQMYIVASVDIGVGLNRELFSLDGFQLAKLGNTDKVRYGQTGTFDLTIPDNSPHIFNLSKAEIALFGRIDELSNSIVADGSTASGALQLQIAEDHGGAHVGEINIAEVLIFKDQWHAIGSDFDLQVLQYLRNYHFGEIPLPMSFNAGGPWLDNTP